jgi:hypothetical protein
LGSNSFQVESWGNTGELSSSAGSTGPHSETTETAPALDPSEVEKAIEQRSYRLQELLESERVYINDLVPRLIKRFFSSSLNKLECLAMAELSSLV